MTSLILSIILGFVFVISISIIGFLIGETCEKIAKEFKDRKERKKKK